MILKRLFFILFSFVSFSYSYDCSCSSGYYPELVSSSTYVTDINSYDYKVDCAQNNPNSYVTYTNKTPYGDIEISPGVPEYYSVTKKEYQCYTCTESDVDIVVPDGKVIQPINLEDTSQTGGCPVLDSQKVNECLALPGGEIVSGKTNCCSVYACVALDSSNCPANASPDPDNPEYCKCNDGYEPSYSLDGTLECLVKQCPPTVDDLPFFVKVTPADISLCNFFPLSDSSYIELDSSTGCCYGQPNVDDNSTCPPNNIEVNGKCYPITSSDDNDAPVSHDCPMGEYWSFSANGGEGGCVPFFPDENGTDSLPSDGGLDGTITDQDGNSSAIDLGYNFDKLGEDQDFSDGLVSDVANLDGVSTELNKLLDSYVLIDLPLQASGSCDMELVKCFVMAGQTRCINLNPWVDDLTQYMPIIRSLVIFSFIFSGVLIVLGRGGD